MTTSFLLFLTFSLIFSNVVFAQQCTESSSPQGILSLLFKLFLGSSASNSTTSVPSSTAETTATTTITAITTVTLTMTTTLPIASSSSSTPTATTTSTSTTVPSSIENPWSDPRGVYSTCSKKGTFVFSFDDGPFSYTGTLLDDLKAAGVKATFFVIGKNVLGREAILKRAYDEGHIIGSHTYTHSDLTTLSKDAIITEMQLTSDAIYNAIGLRPRYMRPPYGTFNSTVTEIITQELGYKMVMWNFDTFDWQYSTVEVLLEKVTDELTKYASKSTNRSLLTLMHDIQKHTVDGQMQVISAVKASPFSTIINVDECIDDKQPYM